MSVSWILGADFQGHFIPGRVSCGKLVLGEELDKEQLSHPGARPVGGAGWRAPGGLARADGAQSGPAQSRDIGLPPCGFTIGKRHRRGPEQCGWGGGPK